jgi:hypothetical protein
MLSFINRRIDMGEMLPVSAAAVAMLGVMALAPARAQTIFDLPGEVVGGAVYTGEAIVGGVTRPIVGPYEPYRRHRYIRRTVGAYPRSGYRTVGAYDYGYAPAPVVSQCGLGFGCRYYYPDAYGNPW